ncbi:MAG: hypothetical protein ACYC5Q_07315 [Thermoleophilia bacterium]
MPAYVTVEVRAASKLPERYAAEVEDGSVVRACGPLDRLEGLGTRAVRAIMCDETHPSAMLAETASRLQSLILDGRAEIVAVPDVVRVRVGIMGDSLDDDIDTHRFSIAWVDRIRAAYGVDDVCVACTVNLRGLPAKDHSTAYWTADGARHDRAGGAGDDLLPITQWCWAAALEDARISR